MKLPPTTHYPSVRSTINCSQPPDFRNPAPLCKSLPRRISKGTLEASGRYPKRVIKMFSKVLCCKKVSYEKGRVTTWVKQRLTLQSVDFYAFSPARPRPESVFVALIHENRKQPSHLSLRATRPCVQVHIELDSSVRADVRHD